MRFCILSLFLLTDLAGQTQYVISTIAGGAASPTPTPATQASVGDPPRVAADAAGNLYFGGNHCVFKVSASGTLTRVAGTGQSGYAGDGGPAISAQLEYPDGIAVDAAGNIYVADLNANVVRVISPAGTISTFAGRGAAGFGGDSGPATQAEMKAPMGLAIDAAGNVYIADSGNNVVRKVAKNGVITTVAGNGSPGYSGDGAPATAAALNVPEGLAADATGQVYIADTFNNRVRVIGTDGNIHTVAGTGESSFSGDGDAPATAALFLPTDVTTDGAGNLYIADFGNSRIREVSKGVIQTVVGGKGTETIFNEAVATSVLLNGPTGVAVDSAGNIYVVEGSIGTGTGLAVGDNRVWEISSGVVKTAAGNGVESFSGDGSAATAAQLNNPAAMAFDAAGNLYIADASNNRVRKISPLGSITTVAGNGTAGWSGDGGPGPKAQLNSPQGISTDTDGNVYIADTGNNRIVEAHQFGAQPASSVIATDDIVLVPSTTTFGGTALSGPQGLALDSAYDLFIADTGNNRIVEYSATGAASVVGTGSVTLSAPYAVTVYPSGALVVADANAVYLINGSNSAKLTFPTYATAGAKGVALGQFGDIFVSNTAGNQVLELNTSATPTLSFPATNGGSSSTDVTLVVSNEGNTALTDSAVATSTANFSIDTANNTCTATASTAAGSSCNLVLQFTPQGTSTGTETGTATITDNQLSVASLVTSTSNETATFTTSGAYTVNLTGTATVAGQPQTITFPAFSPSTVQYATTPIALTATDNSGLPITYTVTSGPGSITGTASAPTLTITGIGTITVQATQTGGVNGQGTAYAAATPQSQSLTVTQASQTITFTPASPITYGGASNTIDLSKVASATSGLPVSFSVTSGPGTISGTTLTVTNAGTIVIAANQAGNTDYSAAPTVTAQIVVNPVGTLPAPVQTDGFSYTTGGLYNSKFLPMPVTLSDATSGTSIYYTTDGSTPSPNSGTTQLYKSTTGLPTISATTTLKAIAVETGYTNSSVTTITYTVDSNPETLQLALSATSLSLGLGQSGTITITVTPQHGLISALQYSCMGVPAGGTCTFTPATANAVPLQTPVTLTMTVTAPTTMAMLEQRGRSLLPETTFALCLCLFGWRRRRNVRIALMLLVATIGLTWISGCGSGGTSSENWPLTVAIGADTVRTTANVALTIHK